MARKSAVPLCALSGEGCQSGPSGLQAVEDNHEPVAARKERFPWLPGLQRSQTQDAAMARDSEEGQTLFEHLKGLLSLVSAGSSGLGDLGVAGQRWKRKADASMEACRATAHSHVGAVALRRSG